MTIEIEALPIIHNITLVKGGDWHETINLYEDDRVTPKNTAGYEMEMTILSGPNGETYDFLDTVVNTRITHTPSSGQFNIDLEAAEIEAYDFLTAVRKVILIFDTGDQHMVLIMGQVKVIP